MEVTSTAVVTSTQIDDVDITTTVQDTTTIVETSTKPAPAVPTKDPIVETVVRGPCDDVERDHRFMGTLYSPFVDLLEENTYPAHETNAPKVCCDKCFKTPGCVFFKLIDSMCEIWTAETASNPKCVSGECPVGRKDLIAGPINLDHDYYLGPCPGTIDG